MDLRYNADCDSAYILLDYGRIVSTRRLPGLRRMVDYDGMGRPLGVILHQLREGVDLEGLPFADEISALLRAWGVPVHRNVVTPALPFRLETARLRIAPGVDGITSPYIDDHRHDTAA